MGWARAAQTTRSAVNPPGRAVDVSPVVGSAGGTPEEDSVMTLLRAGIPLTLLCDLLPVDGPDSVAIFHDERVGPDPQPPGRPAGTAPPVAQGGGPSGSA